jgi:ABC-type lipoprotein export system ATPase subunit
MASFNIKFFTDILLLERYYKKLSKIYGTYVAVSPHTPLLSNLNIIENIALIEEVHQNFERKKSHANALKKLKKLNLQHLETKRSSECSDLEIFSLSLIRASMMKDVIIVVITPLVQYQAEDSLEHLYKVLDTLEIKERTIILDLSLYENDYRDKGIICNIIK